MPLELLRARLRHEDEATPAMLLGRAFHAVIESEGLENVDELEREGITMRFALDETVRVPPTVELKTEMMFESCGVNLVGRVDALDGLGLADHKCTGSRNVGERIGDWADKFQWKAYVVMFEAEWFDYWLWEVSQLKYCWKFKSLTKLRLWRYPGIEDEVRIAVEQYADFYRRFMQ